MIVRILGDGQYDVPESLSADFERVDSALVHHVEAGDEAAYHRDLAELVALVQQGEPLGDDDFRPSDAVVPNPAATLAELQELLEQEQSG